MSVVDIARSAGGLALTTGAQVARAPQRVRSTGSHLALLSVPRRRLHWSPDFYDSASGIDALAPGDLIRAEPMHAYLLPGVRLRAKAWRILYRSTGAIGESTAVSGTLLLPAWRPHAGEPLPLVAYAIGTHGISDDAAPSRLLSTGLDWEAGLMAMVLARGFAIVVTDYQGLGTPGDHAYMVGRALGCNVLDAIRAARELAPAELEGGPTGVMGYSEGGTAAAWAAQLQPSYAPELELAGVAAGAAAADVELAGPTLDGSFFSFFLVYGAIGYAAAYPELVLEPYLVGDAADTIEALRHTNIVQAAVRGPRFAHVDQLTNPNVLELPSWRARLRENRLGTMAPSTPVLLHHARHDQIVAFEQSEQLFEDWRGLGVEVSLHITRGGFDHISGAVAGSPFALDWLDARLAQQGGRGLGNVVPLRRVA